jgi:hypothetical protein
MQRKHVKWNCWILCDRVLYVCEKFRGPMEMVEICFLSYLKRVQCIKAIYKQGIYSYLFSILWGRWSGDHPQEDLAKFGNKLKRKVEKIRNPAIFGIISSWNILSKPGDFRFFPLKIWPNFQEKSFVEVALAFLLSPSDKNSPKQKKKLLEASSNLRNVARTRMEALPSQAHWQMAGK